MPTVALGESILRGFLVDLLLFAVMQVLSHVRHGLPTQSILKTFGYSPLVQDALGKSIRVAYLPSLNG